MKNKLLLFLLFHLLINNQLIAKSFEDVASLTKIDFDSSKAIYSFDSIKKNKKKLRTSRIRAVLLPPTVIAGSSCGNGVNSVQVNLYANGVNAGETVEWYASQVSVTPIFTGSNFSPSIVKTRTYYVQSKSGADTSIRVPVVASVYSTPPAVTLTVSPENNVANPLCLGTSVTFTASGGADLFEFSVDGVVKQAMSTNRIFTTNTLTNGQEVSVRSRYAISLDGTITEKAWGTDPMEDNFLSASLSANASGGYLNSIKISPTEDKLVFGIAGKLINNRSILLFLDSKSGGFPLSDYGTDGDPLAQFKAFNLFNKNPSTFDSYFAPDYCIAITTDAGETNYYADIIELKSGNSIKTSLGSAATGLPSALMGINKNNAGISDYSLGFEIEVLKSLIGYTTGDIKFFALTMQDGDSSNYNVTNSFLSPERTSILDYGSGAVDYNLKDPNPVIVSSLALTPCYSESNITMNFVENPTVATVGGNQFKCILTSDALGGNSPSVGIGTWTLKSGPGTVSFSDSSSGSSTATVSVEGVYVFTWTITSGACIASSADVTVEYTVTPPPIVDEITQPTCADNSGRVLFSGLPEGSWTITPSIGSVVTGTGTTYEFKDLLAGTDYTFTVTNPNTSCISESSIQVTINAVPLPPIVPTTVSVVQPTCATPSGTITITTQTGVEYSLDGTTYQDSNVFGSLAPNSYTLYVRNSADATCVTTSPTQVTINAVPLPPVVPTTVSVVQPTCATPSGTITITTQTGVEYSLDGTTYQDSNVFGSLAPSSYTLYVRNSADATCVTTSPTQVIINAVPLPPVVPTTVSVVQPTCATPSGTITVTTQTGVEYSLDGTTYQDSNVFGSLAPNSYTLYVRNSADATCVTTSPTQVTINAVPLPPIVPTTVSVVQPTCATPSGTITVTTQTGVEYSLDGTTYQDSNVFGSLAPNSYTLYVRNSADATCVTTSPTQVIINAVPLPPVVPTTVSVVQPTCATPSGTITITTQTGVEYSLDGTTYQDSNVFGSLAPNSYTLYVRNSADATCVTTSPTQVTINAVPLPPVVPTTVSVVQPTCATPSGTITITTQTGVEYSLDGTTYQDSNVFGSLAPSSYTLYVRNSADATCVTTSPTQVTINAVPLPPVVPTTVSVVQPTCATPSGTITITTQTGVEYSLDGTTYQDSNVFGSLAPNSYTLYVRNSADATCVTTSPTQVTINAVPLPPVVPTTVSVVQPTCATPSGTITITTQTGVEYSLDGTTYQDSNVFGSLAPSSYTLYVRNSADATCVTTSPTQVTINAVPLPPIVPTTVSVVQPTCATPSGTITITTQTGVEYSLDGTTYQDSNVFGSLAPNSYTLYVRNSADATCVTTSPTQLTINAVPLPPIVPTTVSVVQPTCATPSGTITVTTQTGVEYSLDGTTYQDSNVFGSLAPNSYTLYVRNSADATCVTTSPTQVTINAVHLQPVATTTSIVQPTCAVQSGTIVITQQMGMEYSLDGATYQGSNTFTGLTPNSYTLYVRNSGDNSCAIVSSSVVTINAVPTPPIAPTLFSVVQPTCAIPSGTIAIVTQTGVEYSLNGTTYQTSEIFSGLVPNMYTLYVRNIADHTCSVQSVSGVLVDALPPLPEVPTLVQVIQPTCLEPTGSIEITPQAGVQYSIGNGYQDSNVFENIAPGNYILSVRFTSSIACISSGTSQIINPVPPQIQFETIGDCDNKQFTLTASPLGNSYDPDAVSYVWKDKNNVLVGTNSNVLNVSEIIESSLETEIFPLEYTLTITSSSTGCETSEKVTVESIYCNLQKGISPDGNGSNDYFDLRLLDVKKLEVFNRYGIKVYSQSNYTDQWKGQSDNGNELPSATYYYVIEMNNGQSKTGWIYLIREK